MGIWQLAGDLVAEAVTKARTSWQRIRGLDGQRAWSIRAALNAHLSLRQRRREVASNSYGNAAPPSQDTALGSSLVAALWCLPTRQRQGGRAAAAVGPGHHHCRDTRPAWAVAAHFHRALTALSRGISTLNHQELTP
jgi:hypothetical protein